MWNPAHDWQPVTSFAQPVKPPANTPDDTPQVCFRVNVNWLSVLAGMLMQGVQPKAWDMTGSPFTLYEVQTFMTDIIAGMANAGTCVPLCAGMDPAHQPTWSVKTGGSSVLNRLHLTATRTLGGVVVMVPEQDAIIPGAGDWGVWTDLFGNVFLVPLTVTAADAVRIASLTVTGNGQVFACNASPYVSANPGLIAYTTNTGSGPVDTWPSTQPLTFPEPASFDGSELHNPHTPAGDTDGFWAFDGFTSTYAAVATLAYGPVDNGSDFGDPLWCGAMLIKGACLPDNPCVSIITVPSAQSMALTPGTPLELAINTLVWPGAQVPVVTLGNSDFTQEGVSGEALGVSVPFVTVTNNFATC